jgi:hypothetical protein
MSSTRDVAQYTVDILKSHKEGLRVADLFDIASAVNSIINKRTLYDVGNVLEGAGLLEKSAGVKKNIWRLKDLREVQ